IPSAVESVQADPEGVRGLQARFGLAGRRVLVTAAALSPEKDPLTLIEAIAILRRDHPDVACLHCGADGAAAGAARARVAELGLQDHYRFAGFLPQVADALALAEAYVSSSRFEALGTSVLDACLAGLPVVATDVGGHREILAPDRGLLVPAGDAATLARRISWVLDHPQAARAMGDRARETAAREYAVQAMVARKQSLYRCLWRAYCRASQTGRRGAGGIARVRAAGAASRGTAGRARHSGGRWLRDQPLLRRRGCGPPWRAIPGSG